MTNKEIWEAQLRHRRLTERSKTIVGELRGDGADALHLEAAEVIEWLLETKEKLRRDLDQEIREGQRGARDAYAQGQQDEYDRSKDGWR